MKISNARIEMDTDTFAPIVVFEGRIEIEAMQDNHAIGGETEEEYIAKLGADIVAQIKEQLKNSQQKMAQ